MASTTAEAAPTFLADDRVDLLRRRWLEEECQLRRKAEEYEANAKRRMEEMEGEERRNNEETTMEDETEKLETPKKYPHVGVPSPLHDQTNGSSIGGALLPHQQLLGAGCGANASLAFWAVDSAR